MDKIGGNSVKASSGINFLGENDSYEIFYSDILKSSNEHINEELIKMCSFWNKNK
jgi:succinate dehydrogenase/fumarate reductase flavoprotein subunit